VKKLSPCPFCGNTYVYLVDANSGDGALVYCSNCCLETPTEPGTTKDEAIDYWNKREWSPPSSNRQL